MAEIHALKCTDYFNHIYKNTNHFYRIESQQTCTVPESEAAGVGRFHAIQTAVLCNVCIDILVSVNCDFQKERGIY